MVVTGERSQKIRTYNYPQNRVTDHRIRLTLNKLDRIIEGDLDELVTALRTSYQAERLQAAGVAMAVARRAARPVAAVTAQPRTTRPEMRAAVERDALVVGMTLVPGFVSRNRSFALFEDPEVRRARRRAGVAARHRAAARRGHTGGGGALGVAREATRASCATAYRRCASNGGRC